MSAVGLLSFSQEDGLPLADHCQKEVNRVEGQTIRHSVCGQCAQDSRLTTHNVMNRGHVPNGLLCYTLAFINNSTLEDLQQ